MSVSGDTTGIEWKRFWTGVRLPRDPSLAHASERPPVWMTVFIEGWRSCIVPYASRKKERFEHSHATPIVLQIKVRTMMTQELVKCVREESRSVPVSVRRPDLFSNRSYSVRPNNKIRRPDWGNQCSDALPIHCRHNELCNPTHAED